MRSPEPDNQTNLLLAVVLSMAVMFAWQFFFSDPRLKDEQVRRQRESQKTEQAPGSPPVAVPQPGASPGTAPAQPPSTNAREQPPVADRATALAASPRVSVETPTLRGSISLKGGRIDDLALVKHRERLDPKSPNVVLFSPLGAPGAYFAEHGWQSPGQPRQKLPDSETEWRVEAGSVLTPNSPVTLAWDNGQGLLFRRTISVDADYMFTIVQAVENKTAEAVLLGPYARIYRIGTPKIEGFFIQHEGLIGVQGDEGVKEITYKSALEPGETEFKDKSGGWIGFTDKYWASALVPPQTSPFRATLDGHPASATEKEYFWADYAAAPVTVAANSRATYESRLFAGAKQTHIIDGYEERFGIERFNKIIDWGYLYFITKPLFYLIDWLYKFLGNFGVAILAVTIIVKAAFFPLANKSYESMAKMKKLQPEMEKLRERFKDDKQRQQQELMKLYQTQKINPLAGCLPILLQIPVFFALYKVLYISIDMRHAPFFGWVQDLSAPDPTSLFNLFGLLPYDVPATLNLGFLGLQIPLLIGIWPLLMGITMWLQMQLNPPQPDPTQQMIFNWMPVLFTFLLASFPAGLVIYWTWNNILSLAQQGYILKSQGAEVALGDNLKRTFAPVSRLGIWKRIEDAGRPLAEKAGLAKPRAENKGGGSTTKSIVTPSRAMTREQALSTLGLKSGASRREIEAAYKTLIKDSDLGASGSGPPLSVEINKARDVLLRNGRA